MSDLIRGAIFLEHRGRAFYEAASQNTKSEAAREISNTLAEPEDEKHADISSAVITKKVRQEVSAAGYEGATISSPMVL